MSSGLKYKIIDSDNSLPRRYIFSVGERYLMMNSLGYMVMLDEKAFKQLSDGKISDGIRRKLENRGFLNENREIEDEEFRPEFFMIDLTNKCNLRCRYCFRNIETGTPSISEDVLDDICEYITLYCDRYRLKDVSIQAWGGEPLLDKKLLFRIKEHIHPEKTKVHYSIETNGTLLSKEMVDELYNNRIGIGISIDGRKTEHDAQRVYLNGDGSFGDVTKGVMRTLEKYGNTVGTITTITRNNYNSIEQILDYYAEELHLKNLKFNFVHKSKFVENDELCLSTEEIKETEVRLFDKLINLVSRGHQIFDLNIKTKIRNVICREYSDVCLSRGCCGGRKMIVIDKTGGIYPCELTDYKEMSFGTIYEAPDLISLLKRKSEEGGFFEKKCASECKDCPWYFYCRGGCTVRMINSGKRAPEIDEIECAVNCALYPKIIELILTDTELAYTILDI